MDANQLRAAFTGYFAARDHEVVPSASLIPHDPTVLFTIAGMVPFKPYFVGDDVAPWKRATSVQKCFRTVDIDIVGTTLRHCTFFEMLGNFSFGDYFKAEAIPFAWELVTEVLGIDGNRLWITVHETDDEAAQIWHDAVGVPVDRIQRMGEDNFWGPPGPTGPCGPCSELYFDKGDAFGSGGGPALGGSTRYVEIWNLVFMQFNKGPDGEQTDLTSKCIDTGAGLERIIPIIQGTDSVFDTDVLAPLVTLAEELTATTYGNDDRDDVALRVLADHGRAMTVLVADGVLPSNEGRGYVLRRIVRRAVLAARRLGSDRLLTPELASRTVEVMGEAYPKLREELGIIQSVLEREEGGFDRTLRAGLTLFEEAMRGVDGTLSGDVAFRLHDTHGFPVELTAELAAESGVAVDKVGYETLMTEQRRRAREAVRVPKAADEESYRSLLESVGPTTFVGRTLDRYSVSTRVVGVLAGSEPGTAEIFLEHTPFYAEGGGQVGDKGTIATETGRAEVYDTIPAIAGLTAHRAKVTGEIHVNQEAMAAIDAAKREATRRNHTGTHLLHAALREILGEHVRQQGSSVDHERLRFDFSHHGQVSPDELRAVVEMVNVDVVGDNAVEVTETTKAEADSMGALSFFGDKYGDIVRVVRAGPHSLEFCGGTHVDALGMIGPISVVSEASIGANTRRIEAVTGSVAVARGLQRDVVLDQASAMLKVEPDGFLEGLERLIERQRSTEKELQRVRSAAMEADGVALVGEAGSGGIVVARRDRRSAEELRSMATVARREAGVSAVVLAGTPDGAKVAVVVATTGDPDATALVRELAAIVGGGGGGSSEIAVAGGRDPDRIEECLARARALLGTTTSA